MQPTPITEPDPAGSPLPPDPRLNVHKDVTDRLTKLLSGFEPGRNVVLFSEARVAAFSVPWAWRIVISTRSTKTRADVDNLIADLANDMAAEHEDTRPRQEVLDTFDRTPGV